MNGSPSPRDHKRVGRRLPARARQWAFVPGVGGLSRCAALAQSPGLRTASHRGPGGPGENQGDKEARPLPRQSQPRRWGHRAGVPATPGPHSARVSEAGHQPAMPASQSCGRRVPTLQPGLGQPCCSNPPSEGRQAGPPPSLLSLPLSHPHPEGSSTGGNKPPSSPQTATATALLEIADPWGSIRLAPRLFLLSRPHAWWGNCWCAQHCQELHFTRKQRL